MKIGLVRSDLSGNGGAERYSLAVLERLAARGWETHVFTARLPEHTRSNLGLHAHLFAGKKTPRFFRHIAFQSWLQHAVPPQNLDFLLSLERVLPNDIYRAGGGVHWVWRDIQLKSASKFSRTLASLDPSHAQMLRAEKAVFSTDNTRMVICNSTMVADEVTRCYGYPPDRLRVVPNGVDLEKFTIGDNAAARERCGFAPGELAILFAGSGFWRKGADIVLRIMAEWKKLSASPLKAVFVGRAENDSFKQLATELGLDSTVRFMGPVAPSEMVTWYQAADVFLFPTRYDPFANACLEAAACGAAVATSSYNGFNEHLKPSTGLLLPERPETASRALEDFCAARVARSTVRASVEHLTLDAHMERLLTVFDEAAKFPRPRRLQQVMA